MLKKNSPGCNCVYAYSWDGVVNRIWEYCTVGGKIMRFLSSKGFTTSAKVVGADVERKNALVQEGDGQVWLLPLNDGRSLFWATGTDASTLALNSVKYNHLWGFASAVYDNGTKIATLDTSGNIVNGPHTPSPAISSPYVGHHVDASGDIYHVDNIISVDTVHFADFSGHGLSTPHSNSIFHSGTSAYLTYKLRDGSLNGGDLPGMLAQLSSGGGPHTDLYALNTLEPFSFIYGTGALGTGLRSDNFFRYAYFDDVNNTVDAALSYFVQDALGITLRAEGAIRFSLNKEINTLLIGGNIFTGNNLVEPWGFVCQ